MKKPTTEETASISPHPMVELAYNPEENTEDDQADANVTSVWPLRMDTKQAAEYLGVEYQTLVNWRHHRRHLDYLKIGAKIIYEKSTLDAFLDDCRIAVNA